MDTQVFDGAVDTTATREGCDTRQLSSETPITRNVLIVDFEGVVLGVGSDAAGLLHLASVTRKHSSLAVLWGHSSWFTDFVLCHGHHTCDSGDSCLSMYVVSGFDGL